MEKVEICVYSVDELSEKARRRAFSDWQENAFISDDATNTVRGVAEILGVKIKNFWFDYGGGRLDFDRPDDTILNLSGGRALAYIWNNYRGFWRGKYYSTPGRWENGKYHYQKRYSKIFSACDTCNITGVCTDYAAENVVKQAFNRRGDLLEKFTIGDFFDFLEKELIRECVNNYIWDISEDRFIDDCACNGWRFLASGEIFVA